MAAAKPPRVSETIRERETFKYDALAFSTARHLGPQPPPPLASSLWSLTSTPDPGLTAFAQLGLYKLNATRSLISLFDRHYQHIIGEAIRPPAPGKQPAYFNGLTFERVTSVCEHVVTGEALEHTYPGTASGLNVEDLPVSVVNHLDADVRFCNIQDPARQFYAGVPIRSPSGINIGVYCVFDDKPRPQGLNNDEVRFIRDMSVVIMDYLAYKRSHEWYHREQRMVRGLGSFVEGEPALRVPEGVAAAEPTASSAHGGLGPQTYQAKPPPAVEQQQDPAPKTALPAPAEPVQRKLPTNITVDNHSLAVPPPASSPTGSASSLSKNGSRRPADQLRSGLDRVFSRAANVIRESLEVEGVVFMDATIKSYGGLVGNAAAVTPALGDADLQHSSLESGSSDESGRGPPLDHPPPAMPASCTVLGFSTSHDSSLAGDAVPAEFAACKERFLQRLLQKYPKGRIFNFEADGALSDQSTSSGGDEGSLVPAAAPPPAAPSSPPEPGRKPASKPKLRQSAAEVLIRMFPGARSVAVVPLWDPQTGRSFAGGFLWTKTPTRIFSRENELSYMRVFGLVTMAEVARLKIRAADKAKTDILGSISHELRSPLHGLVGTIEMLRHTALDGFQKSVLWTIDASARTLLDTIDHLLDFIKINNLRSSKPRRRPGAVVLSQSPRLVPNSPSPVTVPEPPSAISLDSLVEEVVESVLAGSRHLTMSETQLHSPHTTQALPNPSTTPSASNVNRGPVQIYVDIDYLSDWSFRVHPGALRRIVMNLFGNSLKFTRFGFIRVSLRQEKQSRRRTATGTITNVVLTVSDSGKGIGEDYLRDHLFIPFSQEDEFAPGTGLGLSLVHRMVTAMGGNIDVASKVGRGTTITVMLPLTHVADNLSGGEEQADFGQDVQSLAGRRVRLRHFETETRIREGFSAEDAKQKSHYQLMKGVCRDLLHMKVVCDGDNEPPPDFVISCTDIGTWPSETAMLTDTCPHVFICQDLASAHRVMSARDGVSRLGYEVLSQPVGPRKLARALLAALLRHQEAQSSGASVVVGLDAADQTPRAQTPQDQSRAPAPLIIPQDPNLKVISAESQQAAETLPVSHHRLSVPEDIPTPPEQPLPLRPAEVPQAVDGVPEPKPQPKSILLVDDNAINLKILAAYMAKLKYDYTTAENGLEAVELYAKEPARYSCVLTDISMPVMDGLEATRRIRELERAGAHPPAVVIALTGLHGADIEQDAVASGVDLFLTRPLMLGRLKEALLDAGLLQKS